MDIKPFILTCLSCESLRAEIRFVGPFFSFYSLRHLLSLILLWPSFSRACYVTESRSILLSWVRTINLPRLLPTDAEFWGLSPQQSETMSLHREHHSVISMREMTSIP